MSPVPRKTVLAYSGGLDTSVILKWLIVNQGCQVIAFMADIGQAPEADHVRIKAKNLGACDVVIEDLREEFVQNYVFPMFRANAIYEGDYLLGTSIARPLIAKRQIEIALSHGADAVAHGATGKGNDQVRFELAYYALAPDIHIVAPWREWDFKSRQDLLTFAEQQAIPIERGADGEPPYSTDANLLHISYEGRALEDPWIEPDPSMFSFSRSPEEAPEQPCYVQIDFEHGDPVAVDGKTLTPARLLYHLNEIGGMHGIGRVDIVENRFIGIKSRGVYETPGGTLLLKARRAIESLTLDREAAHLKDSLMPRYAEIIYNGLWFSPERLMLQAAIDSCQDQVTGSVRLKLYKGNAIVVGRRAAHSLYNQSLATFEADSIQDPGEATGFIRLQALRLRVAAYINNKKQEAN